MHKMQDQLLPRAVSFKGCFQERNITPYLFSGNLLHYDGKPYVVGMGIDITERKKMEDALRDAELKFRTIFDNASDGLLLARAGDRKFVEANEKICQMLGYSKEELLQLGISDIHPEASLPHIIDQFVKLLRKDISTATDLSVLKKDGTVFFADISASIIEYGGVECLLGIFRDITERKRAGRGIKCF